jgi:TetR/AcrR family transcriptional regulator of autoinduction and epiphytic fitness
MTSRIDGRTARRERNRDEVVEAALALIDEGEADPSIEQLTAKSGLSARSIFRYFDGLDDLRRSVIRRHFERVRPLAVLPEPGSTPLDARIRRFVDARIRFNEAVAGPARTARARAPYAPTLADDIHEYRDFLNAQIREQFAPELSELPKAEADDLAAVIGVVVSFDGFDLLARDHRKSRSQIRRAWIHALTKLLAA